MLLKDLSPEENLFYSRYVKDHPMFRLEDHYKRMIRTLVEAMIIWPDAEIREKATAGMERRAEIIKAEMNRQQSE